jgi:VWFA-related protein
VLLVLWTSSIGGAEKPKKKDPAESSTTFRVLVDLVSVNAGVTDKKGNPISDLTQNDFQVLEDGIPQKISVFKVEAAPGISLPIDGRNETLNPSAAAAPLQRKIVLFVDDYHIGFASLVWLKQAIEKFVRNNLGPDDRVALITASGRNSTEFTQNRELIIANMNNLQPILSRHNTDFDCPSLSDYQAFDINEHMQIIAGPELSMMDSYAVAISATVNCLGLIGSSAVDQALNAVNQASRSRALENSDYARRTLLALQTLTRRLRATPGQKILVFLSDGMFSGDLKNDLQRAIDGAIRSNTIIHSINSAGLEAMSPAGDASSSGPTGLSPFSPWSRLGTAAGIVPTGASASGAWSRLQMSARLAMEDAPAMLANDTGGAFLHNNNDLAGLMKSALTRTQVTYLLGYYSTNSARDGKFRKIVVKVNRPAVEISARKGYYAAEGDEVLQVEKNDEIQEALRNPEEQKDIPIFLSFNVAQNESSRSLVAIQTRVDVKKIQFVKKQHRNLNVFTIVTAVYDSDDRFVEGKQKEINFNLSDPNFKNVMSEGLISQAAFELSRGSYHIRVVVREAGETKLGSATGIVDVMN